MGGDTKGTAESSETEQNTISTHDRVIMCHQLLRSQKVGLVHFYLLLHVCVFRIKITDEYSIQPVSNILNRILNLLYSREFRILLSARLAGQHPV